MIACKIDEKGYFLYNEEVEILTDRHISKNWIDEGKELFIPRWNGIEWVESATSEEIEKIKNGNIKEEIGIDEFMLDVEYRLSKLELGV